MIPAARPLQVVEAGDLPEYPLPRDFRMPTHYFIAWWHNRWLNSTLHLTGTYEVQGVAVALYSIAQNQAPIGTLPVDDAMIARLLRIELSRWHDLCRMAVSPLHGWYRAMCQGEVRWAHPVVLEMLMDARDRRERRDLSAEEKAERKRLERLRARLVELGLAPAVADDRLVLEGLDQWLQAHCTGNRTTGHLVRAIRWGNECGLFQQHGKSSS